MLQILTTTTLLNNETLHVDKNIHIIREELLSGYKKLIVESSKRIYKKEIKDLYDKFIAANDTADEANDKIKLEVFMTTRQIDNTNIIEQLTKDEIFGGE